MKIKTQIEWAKLAKPDKKDNKYSVVIRPTEEQQEALEDYLFGIWAEEMGTKKQPAWLGGKKELEDGTIRFTASRKATKKLNEIEVPNPVKVFNKAAVELKGADIPEVANGATVILNLHGAITEYGLKKGVSLFLNSVQLVKYELFSADEGFEPIEEEDEDEAEGVEMEDKPQPATISTTQQALLWKAASSLTGKDGLGFPKPRWTKATYASKLESLGFKASADIPTAAYKALVEFFENNPSEEE
jgi:hypothetical protein